MQHVGLYTGFVWLCLNVACFVPGKVNDTIKHFISSCHSHCYSIEHTVVHLTLDLLSSGGTSTNL